MVDEHRFLSFWHPFMSSWQAYYACIDYCWICKYNLFFIWKVLMPYVDSVNTWLDISQYSKNISRSWKKQSGPNIHVRGSIIKLDLPLTDVFYLNIPYTPLQPFPRSTMISTPTLSMEIQDNPFVNLLTRPAMHRIMEWPLTLILFLVTHKQRCPILKLLHYLKDLSLYATIALANSTLCPYNLPE